MSTKRRVLAGVSLVLSVIVLVLLATALYATWAGRGVLIDLSDGIFGGIDQLAQVGRERLDGFDQRVLKLRVAAGVVRAAGTSLSQGVEERGGVLALLSQEQDETLQAGVDEMSNEWRRVQDAVALLGGLRTTLRGLPFLGLSGPDPQQTVEETSSRMDPVRRGIEELVSSLRLVRQGGAGGGARITAAVDAVDGLLGELQGGLARLDGRLVALQERASSLQRRVRTWFTLAALLATLLLGWAGYGQVVLIRHAIVDLRASPEAAKTGWEGGEYQEPLEPDKGAETRRVAEAEE
jgi:hypothetical protein